MKKTRIIPISIFVALVLAPKLVIAVDRVSRPLAVGQNIPSALVRTTEGSLVDIRTQVENQHTVLLFYQGGWSPYCEIQLKDINTATEDLKSLGYQLIAIGAETPEQAKKTQDRLTLKFKILSDASLSASQAFGVLSPTSESSKSPMENPGKFLPTPSAFFLNEKGKIQFRYISPNATTRLLKGSTLIVAKEFSGQKSEKGEILPVSPLSGKKP